MEQNKTRSYILYAIGEITLVVVGILIALQVNNWNEARKELDFEQKSLTEIRNSLTTDLKFFYRMEERLDNKEASIQVLLDLIEDVQDGEEISEVDKYLVGTAQQGVSLSYEIGPYEGLKSAGMYKVRNDSVRKSLIRLYEVVLPRTSTFIEEGSDRRKNKSQELVERIKELGYLGETVERGDDARWQLSSFVKAEVLSNKLFKEMLINEFRASENIRNRLYQAIEYVKEAQNLLNSHLD